MELRPTDHRYYCSNSNYYVDGYQNFGRCDYDTWKDFIDEWCVSVINGKPIEFDDDLNHLFRFDICERDEHSGEFSLHMFFILQRKGIFRPVIVRKITEADIPEIEKFLRSRWEYLKGQWSEFSDEVK